MTKSSRGGLEVVAGTAVVILLAVAVQVILGNSSRSNRQSSDLSHVGSKSYARAGFAPVDRPCGVPSGAKHVTLDEAQRQVPYELQVPDTDLASTRDADVYMCSLTEVIEYFPTGVSVDFDLNTASDPETSLRSFVKSDSPEASLGRIGTTVAAIIAPHENAVGSVVFISNSAYIAVVGNGTATERDLLDIANSLKPVS